MKHLSKILTILILVLAIILIGKFTGFPTWFGTHTHIEIKKSTLDKGRFVGGDKISISDKIRVQQSGEFVREVEWQPWRNIRKQVNVEYLTESGYFVKDIISSEKVDSIKGNKIIGRSLIVKLPYPDSLFFARTENETIDKAGLTEGWLIDDEAKASFEVFLKDLKTNSYNSFIKEHANYDSNISLSKAALSVLRYVNNGYKIGDEIGFSSIQVIFEETKDLERPKTMVTCSENGTCKQETILSTEKLVD